MENKKFSAGFDGIAKTVIVRAVTITFVLTFLTVMFFDSADLVGAIFWLSLVGTAIFETARSVTLEVRADGVSFSKLGGSPVFYKYEKWYLSPVKGKLVLRAEMRELEKFEDINCRCFTKKKFGELTALIKKRQDAYFVNRRNAPAGGGLSRDEYIAEAIATAAERNPYAKKSKTAAKSIPTKAPISEITDRSVDIQQNPAVSTPETIKLPDPPEIHDFPQITVEQKIPEHTEIKPAAFTHDHGEDFQKAVFYYPRRDIQERAERRSTIAVLVVMLLSVAAFLVCYIAAPGFALAEGAAALTVCVLVSAALIGSKTAKLRGMPSKLEVTKNHFVVDNTRYRFGEMTGRRMTDPKAESGSRSIRFVYGGKQIVCALGPCIKSEKHADEFFGRYGELCALLEEKDFKC